MTDEEREREERVERWRRRAERHQEEDELEAEFSAIEERATTQAWEDRKQHVVQRLQGQHRQQVLQIIKDLDEKVDDQSPVNRDFDEGDAVVLLNAHLNWLGDV